MELMTWIIVAILLYFAWKYLMKKDDVSGKLHPAPKGLPFLGHLNVILSGNDAVFRLTNFYQGSFYLKLFQLNFVVLNTYEELKEAFITKVDIFAEKREATAAFVKKIHRTSFHMISGPLWKEKRRFTMQHLRNFGFGKSVMEDAIINEFNRLCIELDKNVGKRMDINHVFFLPFLNIIWKIIADKTYDYDDKDLLRLSHALLDIFSSGSKATPVSVIPILQYLPGDPFSYWKFVRGSEIEIAFTEAEIDRHLETLKDGAEPRDYIEAYLLEMRKYEGQQLTDETKCYQREHLVGGIVDMIQGGTHTTTTAIRFSLLYMAVWPEIQAKVQHELDTVIGRNRLPSYSDHTMLPYTRATMLEIFRYSSVARSGAFRIASKTTTVGDYTVPKGTLVLMHFLGVHNNKAYWGDPEIFRPERFIDENGNYKPSDNVLPFGIGSRICLGESLARMELFIIFVGLMQRYSFHCITGEPLPVLEPLNETARHPRDFELILKLR